MAEEVKDETVNEETETKDETLESGGEVVTSPIVETSNNDEKYVQLEQRITSLEQRLNGQEQQQQQEQQPPSQQDNTSNVQSDDDSSGEDDGIESNDEIKKILGL